MSCTPNPPRVHRPYNDGSRQLPRMVLFVSVLVILGFVIPSQCVISPSWSMKPNQEVFEMFDKNLF
eukprot:312142-Amphidinium_carterae.1